MKKTALLILTTVTICCCKKKEGKMCCSPYDNMPIKWEMRKSVGGFAGTIIYQPGNGNILEFKSGRLFNQYENGNIFQSGTYDIKPTSEENKYSITFHTNVREWSTNIIFKSDTLVLLKYEPCCDIPDNTYVRIN
jgi:hypothetical protein